MGHFNQTVYWRKWQTETGRGNEVEWDKDENGRWVMKEVPDSNELIDVELVLLAMGFTQPVQVGLLDELGVEYDPRGNVKVDDNKQTSVEKIFAAGDVEKGASLVVHAIEAGKVAAAKINTYLNVHVEK